MKKTRSGLTTKNQGKGREGRTYVAKTELTYSLPTAWWKGIQYVACGSARFSVRNKNWVTL